MLRKSMPTRLLRLAFATVALFWLPCIVAAQQAATPPRPVNFAPTSIPLWPTGSVPNAQGTSYEDTPELLVYTPARVRSTTGVLVLSGGGYSGFSLPTEGIEIAQFLNAAGIPAFVVRYRLSPKYRHPAQLEDGQRAIRYLRANAARYKLEKIGVFGLSAGGHLASMLGTFPSEGSPGAPDPIDRLSARPDFMVLAYPVIGDWAFAAEGSLRNIDPDTSHPIAKTRPGVVTEPPIDPKLLQMLSTDRHVTAQTPPTFLVCADDDTSVSSENSARFYLALKHAGVPAELHIYAHGRHGFGLAAWDPVDSTWTALLLDWMRGSGYLNPLLKK
jgi:acetyl esterase/lipase